MTNRIALCLAALIIAALAADQILNGGAATLFALRRSLHLLDWVMFWR
jgi:hypothetical protein